MNRLSSILVIVDPTATVHPAVEKALILAERCNARIELFACETRQSRQSRHAAYLAGGSKGDFVTDLHALLGALAAPARERGIDVCIETDCADPLYAKLLDRTQRTCADLVVKDTHHHSIVQRTFMTNTDWHLIRHCPVPLLLTKAQAWSASPVIAAAVDPGHVNDKTELLDQQIIEWAQCMAQSLHGSLHLLHAYLPLLLSAEVAGGNPVMAMLPTEQMMENLRSTRQAQIRELARGLSIDATTLHVEAGIASEVLPRVAQQIGAEILSMGAVSRSALQRVFIGGTAERVLEHVPCDVLIVKPPDFSAALPF